jgi:hypothetical protein
MWATLIFCGTTALFLSITMAALWHLRWVRRAAAGGAFPSSSRKLVPMGLIVYVPSLQRVWPEVERIILIGPTGFMKDRTSFSSRRHWSRANFLCGEGGPACLASGARSPWPIIRSIIAISYSRAEFRFDGVLAAQSSSLMNIGGVHTSRRSLDNPFGIKPHLSGTSRQKPGTGHAVSRPLFSG